MSEEDAARVMNYARRERPELLSKTVEEKPWFLKAMGNPVIMGALAIAATKLFIRGTLDLSFFWRFTCAILVSSRPI